MKILGLSDVEVPAVYSSRIRERFGDIDIVVSCGDLPAAYLEFAVSMLDIPLYFVGNHVYSIENKAGTIQTTLMVPLTCTRKFITIANTT